MAVKLDQLLYGYDEGHRLLAQSAELPRDVSRLLLEATDVPVVAGRVVTGIPIPQTNQLAIAAVWSAPEVPRPGAVWSHVLLLSVSAVRAYSLAHLFRLFNRPRSMNYSDYQASVFVPREAARTRPSREAEADLETFRAAFASRSRIAGAETPEEAEQNLDAVWQAQWPELRRTFAFQSRFHARVAPPDCDLMVSIGGVFGVDSGRSADEPWLTALADGGSSAARDLRPFLERFGPAEPARAGSVRALARTWVAMRDGDVERVCERLEVRYPTADRGALLKRETFGLSSEWWHPRTDRRVLAIVGTHSSAWDASALQLRKQVAQAAVRQPWSAFAARASAETPDDIINSLLHGLADAATPERFVDLLPDYPEFATQVLIIASIRHDPATWAGLDREAVSILMHSTVLRSDADCVGAALVAGHLETLLTIVPPAQLAELVAQTNSTSLATGLALADERSVASLVEFLPAESILRLAARNIHVDKVVLREALASDRRRPTSDWLASAAVAIATDPRALEIVFGPLHNAIQRRQFSVGESSPLDNLLPAGPDPSRRLQQYLVSRIRSERWSKQRISRALAEAGPVADQVLYEVSDDPRLVKLVKQVRKRLGL